MSVNDLRPRSSGKKSILSSALPSETIESDSVVGSKRGQRQSNPRSAKPMKKLQLLKVSKITSAHTSTKTSKIATFLDEEQLYFEQSARWGPVVAVDHATSMDVLKLKEVLKNMHV